MRNFLVLAAFLGVGGTASFAQTVISAKAGLIHHIEGDVAINGKGIEPKAGYFNDLKVGDRLVTLEGRAEVLLGPGMFLRLGENSELRMVSTSLADTRLEVVSGSALIEVAEAMKENKTVLTVGDAAIEFKKDGLYRIDASGAAQIRVYDGEAIVTADGRATNLKQGRFLMLDDAAVSARAEKFDAGQGDTLYRWAKRRAGYISMANISSARSIYEDGLYSGYRASSWHFNPFFNMYTYMPYRGVYNSPFGWQYYSPGQVFAILYPQPAPSIGGGGYGGGGAMTPSYNSNLGYNTTPMRSSGGYSAPSGGASAAPAPSRGDAGGGTSGRTGGGGGRGN